MASTDEIKVLLTADPSQLQSGIDDADEAVAEFSGNTTDAATAIAAALSGIQDAITEAAAAMTSAATSFAGSADVMASAMSAPTAAAAITTRAIAQVGETAETQTSRIKAMVAASLAQQAADGGIAESETSVAERMGLRTEATAEQIEATQAAVAAQEEQMVAVDEFMDAEDAATEAVEVNTAAVAENTEAMAVNGGVARELGVLIGETVRGNYTRLEGSAVTLANRTGLLGKVFTPLGLSITGAAAAMAILTEAYVKGVDESEAFQRALLNSGGELGVTEAQFNRMVSSLQNLDTTQGTARDALQAVANTGRITGDNLQAAGRAAADFASLTGESMDRAANQIASLAERPSEALQKLNDQYHFLTAAELEEVEQLEQQGNTTDAATRAIQIFGDAQHQRLQEADVDVGVVVKGWRAFKGAIDDAWESLKGIGRTQTFGDQIKQIDQQIAALKDAENGYINAQGVWMQGDDNSGKIQQLEDVKKMLQGEEAGAEAAAKARQELQQQQDQIIGLHNAQERVNDSLKDQANLEQHITEAVQRLNDLHKLNANDTALKGFSFDSDGKLIQSGQQWAAELKKIQQEYGQTKAKAVDLHKSLEEQLEIDESTDQVSYQNREKYELAFWQQKIGTLKKGTLQYAEAYRTIQTLTKEVDDERAQEAKEAAETELSALKENVTEAENSAEEKKRANASAFSEGTINAQEYLATEKDIDAQLLAAYKEYIDKKRALDAGNTAALNADTKLWSTMQTKVMDDVTAANTKAAQKSMQAWNDAANQISRTVTQAFNQIVFRSGNTTQTVAQQAEQAGGRIIESMVDQVLEKWLQGEALKLAASIRTLLGIGAANNTQAAADIATNTTKSEAMIVSAVGVAGAQGVASFAGAPWPVDMGAPAFGAMMAMEAASFSAAGGWDRVPFDGAQAILHKDEMVLPSHIAGPMRQMAAQGLAGGAGNTHHWHINANDAQSVTKLIRNDPGGLIKAANRAAKFQRNR